MASPTRVIFGVLTVLLLLLAAPRILAYAPGIAGLGLCAFLYLRRATPAIRPAFDRRALGAVLLLLILAGGSSLWSVDSAAALERTLKAALVLLPALLLLAAFRLPASCHEQSPAPPAASFPVPPPPLWPVCAFIAVALYAALELFFSFPLYRLFENLPAAAAVPPAQINRTMVALTILLPLVIGFARIAAGNNMALLTLLCFLPALLLTESQSAQIGILIALLCLFLPYTKKWVWTAAGAAIAMAVALAPLLPPFLFRHFAAPLDAHSFTGKGGAYAGERLEIWDGVARLIAQKPFTGHGIDAARHMDLPIAQLYHKYPDILHPHNFALQFWLEFGALGAACCLVLCGLVLAALYKNRTHPATRYAAASFFTMIAIAAVSYGLWQGWWLGLLALQLSCAALIFRIVPAAATRP